MIKATVKFVLMLILFPIVWTIGALYLFWMLMKGMYATFVTR